MRDVTECSDGFKPEPRKGPDPFATVDANVMTKLPPGSEVVDVKRHGKSFWNQTARLSTILGDGTPASYFLKVNVGEQGSQMMNGEFESMIALYAAAPGFVPKPCGWGSYRDIEGMHFFLCEFSEMGEQLPDAESLTTKVAQMHKDSPSSPTGMTWEEYFVQGMKRMLDLEKAAQGPDEELDGLVLKLYDKVIPRLLRPLTLLGSIEPVLVHGDMWYGNCGVDDQTNKPIVFDACAFWAHNEYEIGTWRQQRYVFREPYIQAYKKNFKPSKPTEDFDDRNALYSIRFDIHSSCAYAPSKQFRQDFLETMKMLVVKYPDGYEGWERENEELVAGAKLAFTKRLL